MGLFNFFLIYLYLFLFFFLFTFFPFGKFILAWVLLLPSLFPHFMFSSFLSCWGYALKSWRNYFICNSRLLPFGNMENPQTWTSTQQIGPCSFLSPLKCCFFLPVVISCFVLWEGMGEFHLYVNILGEAVHVIVFHVKSPMKFHFIGMGTQPSPISERKSDSWLALSSCNFIRLTG